MIPQMTQELWTQKRVNTAAIILVCLGLAGAVWYGYTWYRRSKEQKAYKDLAESIDGYTKVRHSGGKAEKWADVERGFQTGAQRNSSSKLHPYFLAFQADALIEQGKLNEALALMNKAVNALSRTNPLYFLYALKRALMSIDSSDEATKKEGRQELASLAKDPANPMQDMARYYAGLESLGHGDKTEAQNFFKEIADQQSSWYLLAQDKLREL